MNRTKAEEFRAMYSLENPAWTSGDSKKFSLRIIEVQLSSGDRIGVQESGVTAIVGANNAGKSTILREISEGLSNSPLGGKRSGVAVDRLRYELQGEVGDLFDWLCHNAEFTRMNEEQGFVKATSERLRPDTVELYWNHSHQGEGLGSLASFLYFYSHASDRFTMTTPVEMRAITGDSPSHPLHYLEDRRESKDYVSEISKKVFDLPLTLDSLSRLIQLRVGEVEEEAPRIDDVPQSYAEKMGSLPPLESQGDGMRAFFGQILPVVTANFPIVLLDEPEAFLHPPQAQALGVELGRLAKNRDLQIILATHDKNILSGLLVSGVEISVVRTSRSNGKARVSQLNSDQLRDLWAQPVMRYSNVLDGLFHRVVVLAEAEGDCAFLAAALDHYCDSREGISASEFLFVPTGGKAGMQRVASALGAINVPLVAAPDFDIIRERNDVKGLFEAMGGDWAEECEKDWLRVSRSRQPHSAKVTVGNILDSMDGVLNERRDEDFTQEHRESMLGQMRMTESPWGEVKRHGLAAFSGQNRVHANNLLEDLGRVGIIPVREGELENLAPDVVSAKGRNWLREALSTKVYMGEAAQRHIEAIVNCGVKLL